MLRSQMIPVLLAGFCLWFQPAAVLAAQADSVAGHQTVVVEGWTVLVNERLRQEEPEATERALELLGAQLREIQAVVPAEATARLQQVRLWFSPEYPEVPPRAEYHPGAGWLKENGRDPAMARGVEFTNIRIFEAETRRMPNFALHELAHAFHDQCLPGGFANPDLQAAFDQAVAEGGYEQVEQRFGDGRSAVVRAYAMSNPQEYFAESTEAFFSHNDFFPFHREQLSRHDPRMSQLLERLWGVDGRPPVAAPATGNSAPGR